MTCDGPKPMKTEREKICWVSLENILNIQKAYIKLRIEKWSCGVSIPVPLTC